jgi:hypothetical protein
VVLILVASVLYDLPVGKGRLWAPSSRAVNAVVGGWQVSTIATFQTGSPFSTLTIGNISNTDNSSYDRADVVPGVNPFMAKKTLGSSGQWMNPAAFKTNQPGYLGDQRRNVLYGPGTENFDMALHKAFNMPYNEHQQLQIRFEAFNALNHTNPGNPFRIQNIPSLWGKITGGGPARELQIAAKYVF